MDDINGHHDDLDGIDEECDDYKGLVFPLSGIAFRF